MRKNVTAREEVIKMADKPIKQAFQLWVATEKSDPKLKGLAKIENWLVTCKVVGVKATLKKITQG